MINKNILVSSISRGILFEEGTESRLLVIAFSGGANKLMMNPYDFMSETGLINYHRFFLQDPSNLWYQNGINDQLSSFQQLCEYFRDRIRELDVERVLIIGTSSGGYAALLAAHHLKADYAHVFGPQTTIDFGSLSGTSVKSYNRLLQIQSLYQKQWRRRKDFDLQRAMRTFNGKTKYYIHYSADNQHDPARAKRMENIAGVKLFGYPYKTHKIIVPMRKDGYLEKLFLNEHLEDPQQLFDIYYGSDLQKAFASNTKKPSHKRIAQIIQKVAVSQPSFERIRDSKDLPGELALDSVACIELMVGLENNFGINIEMDAMEPEDLKTVDNILHLINRSKKS